jgi:cytoskeleton-associated protein 5
MTLLSTRESVIPGLVQKCLGAPKAGTKQKATDIILLYAEIDVADPIVVRKQKKGKQKVI